MDKVELSEEEFVKSAVRHQLDQLLAHYPTLVREHVARSTTQETMPAIVTGVSDRANVERALAYLGSLADARGQRADDSMLDVIAHLLERAEEATHRAAAWESQARRTEHQAHTAIRRAEAAVRKAAAREDVARRVQTRAREALEAAAASIRTETQRRDTRRRQRQVGERRRT